MLKEKIIDLRKKGYSYKQIEKELSCARSTISYHSKIENLNEPLPHPNKLDANLIKTIRKESNTLTAKEIAEKYEISVGVVHKYVGSYIKRRRIKPIINKKCFHCGEEFQTKNNNTKYCSPNCKNNYYRQEKINKWLNGEHDGRIGKTGTARWIKLYLIKKHGEKCMECGWSERNVHSGRIPIELEHIDGDFRNNKEENLKLLCPNCHSLTPTYKSLNNGCGRPRK